MNFTVCQLCDYESRIIRMHLVDLDNSINRTGQPVVVCDYCYDELDKTRIRARIVIQGSWTEESERIV